MHPYTNVMLDVIGMPRSVNIKGRAVDPAILFSPALAESLLFWHAASLSSKLHGEILLGTRLVADPEMISGVRLANTSLMPSLTENSPGLGLASAVMLISESGSRIIAPCRKNPNFDYERPILSFREAVRRRYDAGAEISPDDIVLQTVFYDTIVKPVFADIRPSPSPGARP